MKRDSNDTEWLKCKEIVDKRDRHRNVFIYCLSMKEGYQLKAGSEKTIDHAHVLSASHEPALLYNPKNVVCLERWCHRRMDDYRNPLTGNPIKDLNEHYYWWLRIVKHAVIEYNANENYEMLLREWILS